MKDSKKNLLSKNAVKDSMLFFALGAGILIYSLANHYSMNAEWKLSPYLFPVLIAFFIIALSFSLFVETVYKKTEADSSVSSESAKNDADWKAVLKYVLAVAAYYMIMPHAGFLISNTVFLVLLFLLLGERSWQKIVVLSISTTAVVYVLFHSFLHVMLP